VREHANGVQGVAQLRVAVHDVTATLERYRALLGLADVPAPAEGAASLQLGRTVLKLETPAPALRPHSGWPCKAKARLPSACTPPRPTRWARGARPHPWRTAGADAA
jgi:hypothetical protein